MSSLPTLAFWKNYRVRIAFGATVDFSGYESRLHESCIDSGEICESCDARVHTPILGL
jgi:hypothetical protein